MIAYAIKHFYPYLQMINELLYTMLVKQFLYPRKKVPRTQSYFRQEILYSNLCFKKIKQSEDYRLHLVVLHSLRNFSIRLGIRRTLFYGNSIKVKKYLTSLSVIFSSSICSSVRVLLDVDSSQLPDFLNLL